MTSDNELTGLDDGRVSGVFTRVDPRVDVAMSQPFVHRSS